MNLWIGMTIAAFFTTALDRPAPNAQEVMATVQAYYDRTTSLTAEFEQESIRARTGRKNQRSGKLRVLRPNKIRWDYRAPEPVHYVSDGNILWVYQPQDALAYRMRVEQGGLDTAVRFLAGGVQLTEKFEGRLCSAPEGVDRDNLLFLELKPKGEKNVLRTLVIGVEPTSGAVLFSNLIDLDGNEVRTTYRDLKEAPLQESIFAFEPPPGVRIENLTKPRRQNK